MDYKTETRIEYPLADLLGRTVVSITGAEKDSICVAFVCSDGAVFNMFHYQDCCEDVSVEDVVGDPSCLIGNPITLAEKTSNADYDASESGTWTFYRLGTVMGTVVIRWYGSSNGYYSEEVDFVRVVPKEQEAEYEIDAKYGMLGRETLVKALHEKFQQYETWVKYYQNVLNAISKPSVEVVTAAYSSFWDANPALRSTLATSLDVREGFARGMESALSVVKSQVEDARGARP